ncbi:hypothetical protein [uncultured Trichococcus sp.]|uniref:hypothetical protein n=1 Tax=uncultured Trichococcus sp. TaxID=189665 RepID=UPI0029C7D702|nr:hypothetical protein [uncultured Trichococcus sp.]
MMNKSGVFFETKQTIVIKKMGDETITDLQIGKCIGDFYGVGKKLSQIGISDIYFDYEGFGRFKVQHYFTKFENDEVIILVPNKAQ